MRHMFLTVALQYAYKIKKSNLGKKDLLTLNVSYLYVNHMYGKVFTTQFEIETTSAFFILNKKYGKKSVKKR